MKKKDLIKLLSVITLVCGVIAFVTMFFDAVYVSDNYAFKGLEVAFGYSQDVFGKKVSILNFNFLVALGYLLPLVGGVLTVLSFNGKGKLMNLIGSALLIVGGILLFLMPSFFSSGISDDTFRAVYEALSSGPQIKAFVYVGGVFGVLGGLAGLYKTVLLK